MNPSAPPPRRIGCVSYLNSRPLIEGLDDAPGLSVRFDVPSRLLDDLESGDVEVALCPVIDYHRSRAPLVVVPSGGIGCRGPTLTVRLFSRVPVERIRAVHVDSDSHTSVALLRVLLARKFHVTPEVVPFEARSSLGASDGPTPDSMLLIGDKVVTASPDAGEYRHQIDLGQAWFELTGRPFVFAVWLAREGTALGDLPERLSAQRERNAGRIDEIVARHAASRGWPAPLAREYLGSLLRYAIGPEELAAIELFGQWAAEAGAIERARPLTVWGASRAAFSPRAAGPV